MNRRQTVPGKVGRREVSEGWREEGGGREVEEGGREGSLFAMAYRMALLLVFWSFHGEDGSLPCDISHTTVAKLKTTQWSVQYCPGRVLRYISLIPY